MADPAELTPGDLQLATRRCSEEMISLLPIERADVLGGPTITGLPLWSEIQRSVETGLPDGRTTSVSERGLWHKKPSLPNNGHAIRTCGGA